MINQQLVDYIKQQVQAGVARDVVRKALADAGWAPADIDDSMKGVEPAAASATSMTASPLAANAKVNPMSAMGGGDEPAGSAAMAKSPTVASSSNPTSSDKFFAKSSSGVAMQATKKEEGEHPLAKNFVMTTIAMGIVILLLAGALAFVYFNLSGQLKAAQQASGGPDQTTALQNQVSQLTQDKDALAAQNQTLTNENQELAVELGFFAVAGTSTTPLTATVKGMLSGNATTSFTLTTARNTKVLIANSKDAKVTAALTPLANGTTTVTLSGTHPPASLNFTVTAVNGASL